MMKKDSQPPFELPNARVPLKTPTYEGSGQVVHPDILKFEGNRALALGYEFIMAITPYPYGNDRYENPSILFSKNGLDWVQSSASNPIDQFPGKFRHHADPNLAFKDGEYYLYWLYRFTLRGHRIRSYMKLKKSRNGHEFGLLMNRWRGPPPSTEIFYDPMDKKFKSILFPDYYSESVDGLHWSPFSRIDISLPPGYIGVRHCEIVRLSNGKYWMLFNDDSERISIWFAESDDCINWDGKFERPVMRPNPGSWDSASLYKCSFIVERGRIRCWYSACDERQQWHLGYSEADCGLAKGIYSLNIIKE